MAESLSGAIGVPSGNDVRWLDVTRQVGLPVAEGVENYRVVMYSAKMQTKPYTACYAFVTGMGDVSLSSSSGHPVFRQNGPDDRVVLLFVDAPERATQDVREAVYRSLVDEVGRRTHPQDRASVAVEPVFVTHSDADHVVALNEFLEPYIITHHAARVGVVAPKTLTHWGRELFPGCDGTTRYPIEKTVVNGSILLLKNSPLRVQARVVYTPLDSFDHASLVIGKLVHIGDAAHKGKTGLIVDADTGFSGEPKPRAVPEYMALTFQTIANLAHGPEGVDLVVFGHGGSMPLPEFIDKAGDVLQERGRLGEQSRTLREGVRKLLAVEGFYAEQAEEVRNQRLDRPEFAPEQPSYGIDLHALFVESAARALRDYGQKRREREK